MCAHARVYAGPRLHAPPKRLNERRELASKLGLSLACVTREQNEARRKKKKEEKRIEKGEERRVNKGGKLFEIRDKKKQVQ